MSCLACVRLTSVLIEEIPTGPGTGPYSVVVDPDDAIWFTMLRSAEIGRLTGDGTLQRYPLRPTFAADCQPSTITCGPDGALWFTLLAAGAIGRVDRAGNVSSFPLPDPSSKPFGITTGPDDALWFTDMGTDRLGRITPDGEIRHFALDSVVDSPPGMPSMIVPGPDQALWFTLHCADAIGRIDRDGTLSIQALPESTAGPVGITCDGHNLWFVEIGAGRIGCLAPTTGHLVEYALADPNARPHAIAFDQTRGVCWFTEWGGNRVGRIESSGRVEEFELPTADSEPHGLAVTGDGTVYVALEKDAVARMHRPR